MNINDFDLLLWLNLLVAGIALVRIRPALFSFAGGQSITLRALSNVRNYGRPTSHSYLPQTIFSDYYLDTARNIFIVMSVILLVSALIAPRKPIPMLKRVPRLPKWILWLVVIQYVMAILSKKTIFEASSMEGDSNVLGINLGGARAVFAALMLYEAYARVVEETLTPNRAFMVVGMVFLLADYLKGATGYATGSLIFATFLLIGYRDRDDAGRPAWTRMILVIVSCVVLAGAIRTVRSSLSDEGTSASVDRFVTRVSGSEESRERDAEGAESIANGSQAAVHVLECESIYESNHSREWRSVYMPLLYTLQPSFLLGPLGITRPREAAWELGDYFISGGGIAIPGELYWNGGFVCVGVVTLLLAVGMYFCDTRMRGSIPWLLMSCNFLPGLTMGNHYGLAQIMRGFLNGILVLGAYWLFRPRKKDDEVADEPSTKDVLSEREPAPEGEPAQ